MCALWERCQFGVCVTDERLRFIPRLNLPDYFRLASRTVDLRSGNKKREMMQRMQKNFSRRRLCGIGPNDLQRCWGFFFLHHLCRKVGGEKSRHSFNTQHIKHIPYAYLYTDPSHWKLFHVSCSVFSAQLSHKGSFMCREGGMEKKTFPFELTDLQ